MSQPHERSSVRHGWGYSPARARVPARRTDYYLRGKLIKTERQSPPHRKELIALDDGNWYRVMEVTWLTTNWAGIRLEEAILT